ncbi:hypothetical protein [Enterovirga sp. CN4-39]|uniref:hypothetical protein n=1 Tax=Enterovirga sp. CN4-39 TaxID=3400910 RepID=UPI003BFCFDAA
MTPEQQLECPYCDAVLNAGALSCRCCGRDLTPVLPLLRRLKLAENRLESLERAAEGGRRVLAQPVLAEDAAADAKALVETSRPVRRSLWPLPLGFAALLATHAAVVFWLDLSLAVLRLASLIIPFGVGLLYIKMQPRITWPDIAMAVVFAITAIAAMNAIVGWVDSVPMLPQGSAAWRETLFYGLSISASMFSGMLARVFRNALTARGLVSVPKLRESLLAANSSIPMDTLKAIELTILLAGSAMSAVTGLMAGLIGVGR